MGTGRRNRCEGHLWIVLALDGLCAANPPRRPNPTDQPMTMTPDVIVRLSRTRMLDQQELTGDNGADRCSFLKWRWRVLKGFGDDLCVEKDFHAASQRPTHRVCGDPRRRSPPVATDQCN